MVSTPLTSSLTPVGLGWAAKETVAARAVLIGERLSLKALETSDLLSTNPTIVRAGQSGCAVLLRYGVVVTFDLTEAEEADFLESIAERIREPIAAGTSEQLALAFRPQVKERLEKSILWLQESSAERLQVVAEALGKSIVLDHYEQEVARLFERIKPFTTAIQGKDARAPKERELLGYIGGTLLIEQRMLGIVEIGDKPDPIWDHPELDRLYLRLEDEYELRERLVALEQKLALISKTVETALGILQRDSSHRVEWYIVILIVVEIALSIYDMWIRA